MTLSLNVSAVHNQHKVISQSALKLGFIGPMIGQKHGHVTMQGLILSRLFRDAGYRVVSASAQLNRYLRLADIARMQISERKEVDVHVIEVYSGRSFIVADVASWLGRHLGQRVIMWLHGGAMPQFVNRYPNWTRRVLSRADAIVAPSPYLSRTIRPFGFRARVIPNVIDLSAYQYRYRDAVEARLFWMRSFDEIYNPALAIRVLQRLRRERTDVSLVMAGQDKGIERHIRRLAVELGVSDAVRFVGFLDPAAKAREGNAADIFLNTSRVDNMPVAVVEACAMGLPVVATAVGGITDLLGHGRTGLLVADDDEEAMASGVHQLLDNKGLAGSLSANGRALAERSSWDVVRPQWEQLLAEVVANTSRRN